MTKKEVAKALRKALTEAIKSLPDVEYKAIDVFNEITLQDDRDYEIRQGSGCPSDEGTIHIIELTAEEVRNEADS